MIKFQGEISKACQRFLIKQETKSGTIAGIVMALLQTVAVVLLAVFWNLIVLLWLVICVLFAVLGGLPRKGIEKRIPRTIIIDNNKLSVESFEFYNSRKQDMVKNIVDYGEWYKINFYFPDNNIYFVCQKDLIVEGTIEEFEKVFEDKIIRKIKSK